MPSKMLGCNGRLPSNSKSFPESEAGKGLEPEEMAWFYKYIHMYMHVSRFHRWYTMKHDFIRSHDIMYVGMYMCVHAYTYIHTYIYIYICMRAYTSICDMCHLCTCIYT